MGGRKEPMKAYSLDLRERIARAVDQGYARAEIIELCGQREGEGKCAYH